MKKRGHTPNKPRFHTINETNRALRANDRNYLLVVLLLHLIVFIVFACLGKGTQQSVFCNSTICIGCLSGWSISMYLRKWSNSEICYYLGIVPTTLFTFFFMKNLIFIVRMASHSILFFTSCIAAIRTTEAFFENIPCKEILTPFLGLGVIIMYFDYIYKKQHSIPKPEWNPYTCWMIHTQRMYYLVSEVCSLCVIWYVYFEHYGYLMVAVLSLSVMFLFMYILHAIQNERIAQNDNFPMFNICRYLFDQSKLSHKCSEIENGGQCIGVIKAIAPLVKQKNEQHEAIMTAVCVYSSMVQGHLRKVYDNKNQKQVEKEVAIYLFAIGVAGAMASPEYSECEYESYYEKRWRILCLKSKELNITLRGDILFGFVCGTCLSIVKNLNNGFTSEAIIEKRIGIAKQMMSAIKSHKVYLTGINTELRNRGEKKLAKNLFAFLQQNKLPTNGIKLDRNTVKAIFDVAVDG